MAQTGVCGYEENFGSGSAGWSSFEQATGGWDGGPFIRDQRVGLYPNHAPQGPPVAMLLTGDLTELYGSRITTTYYGRTFATDGIGGPSNHWIFSDRPGDVARWRKSVPEGLSAWSSISFTIDANWTDIEAAQAGWTRFSTDTGTKSWRDTIRDVTSQTFYTGNCEAPCLSNFTHDTGIDDVNVFGSQEAQELARSGTPPNPNALLPGVTSGPVLGRAWDPVIDHTTFVPEATVDLLGITLLPSNVALPPLGTLLCLPPLLVPLQTTTPGVPFSVPMPSSCGFIGLALCAQGLSTTSGGDVAMTNALDITIGTF